MRRAGWTVAFAAVGWFVVSAASRRLRLSEQRPDVTQPAPELSGLTTERQPLAPFATRVYDLLKAFRDLGNATVALCAVPPISIAMIGFVIAADAMMVGFGLHDAEGRWTIYRQSHRLLVDLCGFIGVMLAIMVATGRHAIHVTRFAVVFSTRLRQQPALFLASAVAGWWLLVPT